MLAGVGTTFITVIKGGFSDIKQISKLEDIRFLGVYMKKYIFKVIGNCLECPYCKYYPTDNGTLSSYNCNHEVVGFRTIITEFDFDQQKTDGTSNLLSSLIPDWCPLANLSNGVEITITLPPFKFHVGDIVRFVNESNERYTNLLITAISSHGYWIYEERKKGHVSVLALPSPNENITTDSEDSNTQLFYYVQVLADSWSEGDSSKLLKIGLPLVFDKLKLESRATLIGNLPTTMQ